MSLFGKILGKKKHDDFDFGSDDLGLNGTNQTASAQGQSTDSFGSTTDPLANPASTQISDPFATDPLSADPLASQQRAHQANPQSNPLEENYQHDAPLPPLNDVAASGQGQQNLPPPQSQYPNAPSFPTQQTDSLGRNLAQQFVQQQQQNDVRATKEDTSLEIIGLKMDAMKAEIEALKAQIKHLEQVIQNQRRGW